MFENFFPQPAFQMNWYDATYKKVKKIIFFKLARGYATDLEEIRTNLT